jgi:hypothetical protein
VLTLSRLLVGVLLLVFGRRLYWLFVAGIGFVAGLGLAPRLLPGYSDAAIVLVALALAIVGALVAVVATRVVVGIVGFVAGAAVAAQLFPEAAAGAGAVAIGVYVIAGVVGAILSLILLDWALIAISSLAGASLIVTSLEPMLVLPPPLGTAAVLVLAVIGVLIQTRLIGRSASGG